MSHSKLLHFRIPQMIVSTVFSIQKIGSTLSILRMLSLSSGIWTLNQLLPRSYIQLQTRWIFRKGKFGASHLYVVDCYIDCNCPRIMIRQLLEAFQHTDWSVFIWFQFSVRLMWRCIVLNLWEFTCAYANCVTRYRFCKFHFVEARFPT